MGKNDHFTTLYDNMALELRRGVLILAVLSQLREQQYGYSLKQILTAEGLEINEGTLYPLLRRLEGQGLLQSDWETGSGRPRRYYRLSPTGEEILCALVKDWQSLADVTKRLLRDELEVIDENDGID